MIYRWVRSIRYKRVLQEGYVKAKKTYQSSTKHIEIPQWSRDDKLFSSYGYERAEYGEMGKHIYLESGKKILKKIIIINHLFI